MKTAKRWERALCRALQLALVTLLFHGFGAHCAIEQRFDVLQVGTTLYRNVTVTTKSKNYIFILHSAGMTNIRVSDLPPELRTQLGYADPTVPQVKTNTPTAWAQQTLQKIDLPQVKDFEQKLVGWSHTARPGVKMPLPAMNRNVLLIAGAALLALYLFHCFCCMLICRKTGLEPGALVWVPLFQLFPLLKAAGMAPWWFLGFLVPGVNLVAQILWDINISRARGKGFWTALFLIVPFSAPFAFLYLAFSGAPRPRKAERRVEIMTLEAA